MFKDVFKVLAFSFSFFIVGIMADANKFYTSKPGISDKEKPEKDINDTNTQSEKNKFRAEKDILIKKYIDEIEEERKAATKKRDTLLNEIKEIEDKIKKPKQPPSYSNRKSEKPFPRKGGPPIGRPPNGGKKTMKKRK